MRLADIDSQESDAVAITPVQIFQDPKLGSERPSGEAAEN
jgi:hypothetical protein